MAGTRAEALLRGLRRMARALRLDRRTASSGTDEECANPRKLLGAEGEQAVAVYLKKHGHKILARNYTCRCGELDIVARDGDVIVFVEVKTRRPDPMFDPAKTVTAAKRRKVRQVARHYLRARNMVDRVCRFDIASVILPEEGEPQINLIENAF